MIGLPGSGKTTLGKSLADALKVQFVDLDEEVEKLCEKPVASIFSDEGEEFFRERESHLLRKWIAREHDFVMATGGGTPCFRQGMEVMNASGITVFLDVPVDVIAARMNEREKSARPLLTEKGTKTTEVLGNLLTQRKEVYDRAKVIVMGAAISKENILQRIQSA